jgi:hypothetical protein
LPEGVKLKQNAKPQQQLATQKRQSLEWGQCTRHNWPKSCPLNLHKNMHSKLQLLSHKHTSNCFLHVQDHIRGKKLHFTTLLQVKGGDDRGFTDICGYLNNMICERKLKLPVKTMMMIVVQAHYLTFPSISRSSKSLTVQPAPRKRIAPRPNNTIISKSGKLAAGAAREIDL